MMHKLLQLTLDLFDVTPVVAPQKKGDPPEPSKPNFQQNTHVASVGGSFDAIDSGVERRLPGAARAGELAPVAFAHPRASREIALGGTRVAYAFTRSRRRTIGFSIGPDGLAVRAPGWVPLREVEAALHEKSVWIVRKLGEARQRRAGHEAARIEWRDGVLFPFLGEPLRVQLDPGHGFTSAGAQRVGVADKGADADTGAGGSTLKVALAHNADAVQIRDAVQAWLMHEARALFVQRLDHFAPQLGVRWRKLSLSNAGTRWGSASANGSIRLNWRLVHFRLPVIDYVVVHELSHLRVMDHSPQFWSTVASVMPDYAVLRSELKARPVAHG